MQLRRLYIVCPPMWIKGSSDPSHFVFGMNFGKRPFRHRLTLILKDVAFNRLGVDPEIHHSVSESFCRIRLFPTLISKIKRLGTALKNLDGSNLGSETHYHDFIKFIPKYKTVFRHNSDFCVIVLPIPISNPIVTLNPTSEFMLVSGDIKA